MATQCKLYTNVRQSVPPNTWYRILFDVTLRDDGGMYQGDYTADSPDSALIQPVHDGDYIWAREVKFDPIVLPDGDTRQRQFNVRFVRDPYTNPDNTGEADGNDTPGQDIRLGTWLFRGRAGQPVAVEVRHDHTSPVDVIHAQFSATTWDF
jgi:hypothetical protein